MNRLILGVLFCLLSLSLLHGADKELEVVASVDLERYQGKWYEIARLPNSFQDHCTGGVAATYTLQPDGRIRVLNECLTKEGRDQAEGIAKLADARGPNSKLKVRFAPAYLSFLPFVWGDYWVIDVASDYSYALVGDPGRKYLWILARTPVIDESVYDRLVSKAKDQGFVVDRLIRTKQDQP